MKNKRHLFTQTIRTALALGLLTLLPACSPKSTDEATASTGGNSLDNIQIFDMAPDGALPVKKAREQLKAGDEAIVFGQIGGVDAPFLEGYAGFVLGDTDIEFCNEMGDDHCPKPWDACCEDTDKLKVSRASVQFVDAAGLPIEESIKNFSGIKELSEVVVVGKVAASSTSDNLIIEATGLHVKK